MPRARSERSSSRCASPPSLGWAARSRSGHWWTHELAHVSTGEGGSGEPRGSPLRCVALYARHSDEHGGAIDDLARAYRDERARCIAILGRVLGDLDLAEDAVQDAFVRAAERWPHDGVPANAGAWIITTARNRAIDRIRREQTLSQKLAMLEALPVEEDDLIPDERLGLIFACCHPALAA